MKLKINSISRYLPSLESLYDDFQRAYAHAMQQGHLEYEIVDINIGTTNEYKNLKVNASIKSKWMDIYSKLLNKNKDIFSWVYSKLINFNTNILTLIIPLKIGTIK